MQKSAKYALIAVAVIIVLGGVGFYWFVLRDDAPPRASLQTSTDATVPGASDRATADGTWKVAPGEGVFVGYRVQELFGGDTIKKTAIGRTSVVDGTFVISGTTVSTADITADVTKLKSDRAQRDQVITEQGLQTSTFPEATFKLTKPIELSATPEKGKEVDLTVTGELTLHGQTKTVDIPLKAQWDGGTLAVAGGTQIQFADYGIKAPSNAIVSVDDTGEFELQLTFVPA
jgi:polyisoprenoid-binding protein YceI